MCTYGQYMSTDGIIAKVRAVDHQMISGSTNAFVVESQIPQPEPAKNDVEPRIISHSNLTKLARSTFTR